MSSQLEVVRTEALRDEVGKEIERKDNADGDANSWIAEEEDISDDATENGPE